MTIRLTVAAFCLLIATAFGLRAAGQSPPRLRSAQSAAGTIVTAAWDANVDTVTTGYRLRYGTASGQETTVVDVGNVTTTLVIGLVPGTKYFFVVEAYAADGRTSDPSTEVAFTMPTGGTSDPCLQQRVTIVIVDWTRSVKIGDRGRVYFQLIGPLPIIETQIRLGPQVIGGEKGDKVLTDLRDSAGLYFSVPRSVGDLPLTVSAIDNRNCVVTTTTPRTVTVTS